jgi:hypothetical protein
MDTLTIKNLRIELMHIALELEKCENEKFAARYVNSVIWNRIENVAADARLLQPKGRSKE